MTTAEVLQWLTAVAAIALVVLTATYAWTTWLSVKEMRTSRLEAIRPVLHLTPELLGVNFPLARITNIGRGYAKNIKGRLWITVDGVKRWEYEWHLAGLASANHQDFMPKIEPNESGLDAPKLAAEKRRFHMDLTCLDAFDREYAGRGSADWSEITEHLFGAQMLLKDDLTREIERHLESMAKSLHDAVDSFDGVKVITYREQKLKSEDQRRLIEKMRAESSPTKSD